MVMADWNKLEQKFEDGFEKFYKLLGLPFEKDESKHNWNFSYSIFLNNQTMEGDGESIQHNPFTEEGTKETELKSRPIVRLFTFESNPAEEVKYEGAIDIDLSCRLAGHNEKESHNNSSLGSSTSSNSYDESHAFKKE